MINYIPRINQIIYWHSLRYLTSEVKWQFRLREKIVNSNYYSYIAYLLNRSRDIWSWLNDLSMSVFLFSKLGNISDINWFMAWFHLECIEKRLELCKYFIGLYKYILYSLNIDWLVFYANFSNISVISWRIHWIKKSETSNMCLFVIQNSTILFIKTHI